ncbi:hypothetical protein [Lutimonas zeaxanthinifaciens]|uniref:hypothetical protein n=1 Tax=Lutimonas zeaxanthinifaciens TaxID=3060215 RepID=UPI00265D3977|nr:hypothetical protein [Lutimonas sp. YSD2104]WKK67112.1 hypothetical protein QZH61_05685 [Lutimonas sp. YSD2104]
MKRNIIVCVLLLVLPVLLIAQEETNSNESKNELIGNWKIDLRPTPDAEAYFQNFVVSSIDENSFTGTFYGSEIEESLINDYWPKIYFAFSTADQSNEYYHSGYIENGKVYGITYCPDREFTAPWTGEKE